MSTVLVEAPAESLSQLETDAPVTCRIEPLAPWCMSRPGYGAHAQTKARRRIKRYYWRAHGTTKGYKAWLQTRLSFTMGTPDGMLSADTYMLWVCQLLEAAIDQAIDPNKEWRSTWMK